MFYENEKNAICHKNKNSFFKLTFVVHRTAKINFIFGYI